MLLLFIASCMISGCVIKTQTSGVLFCDAANPIYVSNDDFMTEETEKNYVRGCSAECRAHERNRYVSENNLTQAEWAARLEAIGEKLPETVLA